MVDETFKAGAPKIEKSVFISYRRKDIAWALNIYSDLTQHGYDVFFDYTSLASGDFEQNIIGNIKSRAHFLVLLTPDALNRCNEPGDWLRREIETALDERRNIIPLLLQNFSFSSPSVSKSLTGKLEKLKNYNGLNVHSDFVPEAMTRLRERYLNVPLDAVLHPPSDQAKQVALAEQNAADAAVYKILQQNPKIPFFLRWILTNAVGGAAILVTSFVLLAILFAKCSGCIIPLVWFFLGFVQWNILKKETNYAGLWAFMSVFPAFIITTIIGLFGSSVTTASLSGLFTALAVLGFQTGFTQWFFLRKSFSKVAWWSISSLAGWFLSPFIPAVILLVNKLAGNPWDIANNMIMAVYLLGIVGIISAVAISSFWQSLILRGQSKRPYTWFVFNVLFWTVAIFASISLSSLVKINALPPTSSTSLAEYNATLKALGFVTVMFLGGGSTWIVLSGWFITWALPKQEPLLDTKLIKGIEMEKTDIESELVQNNKEAE